jgi:hypothetical protein
MSEVVEERTERLFNLGDQAITLPQGTRGRIAGYEWSDGRNVCGKPLVRSYGWFYHFVEEGTDDWVIIPEHTLAKI